MKTAMKYGAALIGLYLVVAHGQGVDNAAKGLGSAGSGVITSLQGRSS